MNKEEVIYHLQGKLYGLPLALQHTIFEGMYRIECGIDPNKILDWYNKIEKLYNETIRKQN